MPKEINLETEHFIREITAHQSAMEAYARTLLPNHSDPRDLLQESNITLWKKKKQYRPNSNFKAWAFAVVRYHAMNARRKHLRSNHLALSQQLVDCLEDAPAITPSAIEDRMQALRSCLGKLSNDNLNLIKARYNDSKSTLTDYAQDNQKNPSTLRVKLRNLRIQLKQCVNNEIANHESRP